MKDAWLVDGHTFARKVKDPTHPVSQHGRCVQCPSCGSIFDHNNFTTEWPGLPAGVKFDPSDQELLDHLAAKVGLKDAARPHFFIDEFIPTLDGEDGICYTHPEKLPGIRCDGSSIHFFHRPAKAYTTGTRKRRKVQGEDSASSGEVRWHKTGKTRPVIENGKQLGCKKIMVLYINYGKNTKADKTNWVMHQYHLGEQEEEREGEFVVSKIFYQTQPRHSVGTRKGEEEPEAVSELVEEPAHSFPQSASTIVSTSSHGKLITPMTPPSFPSPFSAKQHRGLLGVISEDVNRLNASLLGNVDQCSDGVTQSSGQCIPATSILTSPTIGMDKAKDQGSPDTGCSLEAIEPVESIAGNLSFQPASNSKGVQTVMKGIWNSKDEPPYRIDSALDNIILDTPPDFMLEPLVNSQEAQELFGSKKFWSDSQEGLDWLERRKLSDSQKTNMSDDCNFFDFMRDSQSNLN